ncbi:MAG: glycosyltransferase 87 family protein, partial [Cyclobacteriaceae bacterium]
ISNSPHPAGINQDLYNDLNSSEYFTVYPPLNQLIFWLSTYLFPSSQLGSIVVLRLIILVAELGTIYLMRNLLKTNQLPEKNVLLYSLNPLVIVELTGNLHFEALVIVFLLWSLLALHKTKLVTAAVTLGLSIGSKLVPLIFLPLLLKRLSWKKLIVFYIVTGFTLIVLFAPLLFDPSFVNGMSNSLSLYFRKFEFNASVYFVIREIGFAVKGYNIIATSGKSLAVATLVGILIYSLLQKPKLQSLSQAMLWALTIYLAFATTIHPWYVAPLVALAALGRFRFPILWSFLIFFTYIGYSKTGFQENLGIVIMEYLLVAGIAIWEILDSDKISERFKPINS